jgi:4-carboxymuconolactone decarboxylase
MPKPAPGPRIAPLEAPYEPSVEAMLKKWMPPGSRIAPLALFRTLAIHDELISRMRPLGAGILGHGRVEPREREIVIHRTCARAGAEYEWGVHALAFGKPLGLSDEQIVATAAGPDDDPAWSERDALLVRLADELHDTCQVSDELWFSLAANYGDDQLLELVITAGWYRLLSYVINGAQIESEPWPRASRAFTSSNTKVLSGSETMARRLRPDPPSSRKFVHGASHGQAAWRSICRSGSAAMLWAGCLSAAGYVAAWTSPVRRTVSAVAIPTRMLIAPIAKARW